MTRRPSKWERIVEACLAERSTVRALPRDILNAAAAACRVSVEEMMGQSRSQDVAAARAVYAHAAHEWCGASYPEIARGIGRRSHSTVMTAASRFAVRPADERAEALARVRDALPRNVVIANIGGTTAASVAPNRHGRGR